MKVKLRITNDHLSIYREKTGVIIYVFLISLCCLLFGIVFINLTEGELFAKIIGGVFVVAGSAILLGLPGYDKRIKRDDGAILLSANKKGINIAPVLNMKPIGYNWSDISKIIITKKYLTKEFAARSYAWNIMIIYLNGNDQYGMFDRSKAEVWKSPEGKNISIVDSPKGEMKNICKALQELTQNSVGISYYEKVTFDFTKNEEIYEP